MERQTMRYGKTTMRYGKTNQQQNTGRNQVGLEATPHCVLDRRWGCYIERFWTCNKALQGGMGLEAVGIRPS